MAVKVKVCGLTNSADAQNATDCGADFLGFVHASRSVRKIEPDDLDWIRSLTPPKVAVLAELEADADPCFDIVQSEGIVTDRRAWKVIRLSAKTTLDEVLSQVAPGGPLLLDAYHPKLAGGTGTPVDWKLARQIVDQAGVPVILAGGLNPDNIQQAIQEVGPWAVDASSGLESAPGKKDWLKVERFVKLAKG